MKTLFHNFWNRIRKWVQLHPKTSALSVMLLVGYYFALPRTLFQEPYATVIESKEGELLGAKIARDGQWRFPENDSVPTKFKTCLVYYEDEHFYHHFGFNPVAMVKAIQQNHKAGKVVRGGSTITQQVIRMARKKKRTYWEKALETLLATRLEWRHSKSEILDLYAAHAPFGGNVVGLEMAAWRYFGVAAHQLSWAESATLAVLPNAPSLIYPGKNQEKLRQKRNALLRKLYQNQQIDQLTYQLSLQEPLPQKPYEVPQLAPHLLQYLAKNREGERITTTLDGAMQQRMNQIAAYYYNQYKQNEVHNLALLIIDVKTRNIVSYVGNSPTDSEHDKDVDIIRAPRSTGSILKPLLFADMLDKGELLPNTLVPDIPTQISGYTPQNFNQTFDGAVPAQRALSRSLNIPAVLMLQEHGVANFYETLKKFRLQHINKHPNHYGLSLILGGAESSLWDLCQTYAHLSGTLQHYIASQGKYRSGEMAALNYDSLHKVDFGTESREKTLLSAGAIYLTYEAMKEVNRPEGDEAWKFYDSSLEIAWKTGTSFGNRDAWAIGTTSRYVVGVWVGNASGEGRAALTGVDSAAPILFDVFNALPRSRWFAKPNADLEIAEVCEQSGYLAKDDCPKVQQRIPKTQRKTLVCPYHKTVYLDKTEQYSVNSSCEAVENMVAKTWFVLPPVMEWYYRNGHVDYRVLPPFRGNCENGGRAVMDFIYPKTNSKIYLTKDFDSKVQPVILKVAHRQRETKLFWYVDNQYRGTTRTFHDMPIQAQTGVHYITVVDEFGNEIKRRVEIIKD